MVTARQVIDATPLRKNLDTAYIDTIIVPTQLGVLRDIMCPEMYDYAIANSWMVDGVTASGLDSVAATLMTDYVAPFLHWQCANEALPYVRTSVANNGLFSGLPTQTQSASAPQANALADEIQSTASMYRRLLSAYLEDNKDEAVFELYSSNCGCKTDNSIFKTFKLII